MVTGIVKLTEPGIKIIVGASGYFGRRIVAMGGRAGCAVTGRTENRGTHVPNARLAETLDDNPATMLLAVVHDVGPKHRPDSLLMADRVTTLGGSDLDVGGWGVDMAYSCTQ